MWTWYLSGYLNIPNAEVEVSNKNNEKILKMHMSSGISVLQRLTNHGM